MSAKQLRQELKKRKADEHTEWRNRPNEDKLLKDELKRVIKRQQASEQAAAEEEELMEKARQEAEKRRACGRTSAAHSVASRRRREREATITRRSLANTRGGSARAQGEDGEAEGGEGRGCLGSRAQHRGRRKRAVERKEAEAKLAAQTKIDEAQARLDSINELQKAREDWLANLADLEEKIETLELYEPDLG